MDVASRILNEPFAEVSYFNGFFRGSVYCDKFTHVQSAVTDDVTDAFVIARYGPCTNAVSEY